MILIFSLFNGACSRENAIYPEPNTTSPLAPASTQTSNLPDGFFDQSVGLARTQLQPDGRAAKSYSIELKVTAGNSALGEFNGGSGTGSKAILGFSVWRQPLLNVFPLGCDMQSFNGSEKINISVQVDLHCDGVALYHILARGAELSAYTSTADSEGYSRIQLRHFDPVWVVDSGDGQPIRNPDNNLILVPTQSSSPSSLSALLTRYPNACVTNGRTTAKAVAKSIPTAGIQWSLGSADTDTSSTSFIKRLEIGADVFKDFQ
jgi:hypothetical protein